MTFHKTYANIFLRLDKIKKETKTMSGETTQPAPSEVPVNGAFEIFDGKREELITLTRNGQLLTKGDVVPAIPGILLEGRPFVLHTVNAFGTETCDACTDEVEAFHITHPEVPVYSLTKQSSEEIAAEDAKRNEEGRSRITHQRVTVSNDTAINLGIALAPGEGADKEFWPTALRRTLALVDAGGRIVDIQQPDDQEEVPDITGIYEGVENIK
ncbi:hypothetical protein KW801_02735 [Candidatus Saccharibacteria bacterium]|nr:hypothetical protein [Candidatus Saccharibacteria bacterium]